MPFDTSDLDGFEVAQLAVEYLRDAARWLEDASQEVGGESLASAEASRVLSACSESTRGFLGRLEGRVGSRFGDVLPTDRSLRSRLRQRPELVSHNGSERSLLEVLEVAASEEEDTYQFFLEEAELVEDPWLRATLVEIADHTRGVLVYLEEELETLREAQGS